MSKQFKCIVCKEEYGAFRTFGTVNESVDIHTGNGKCSEAVLVGLKRLFAVGIERKCKNCICVNVDSYEYPCRECLDQEGRPEFVAKKELIL